jgi:integrase
LASREAHPGALVSSDDIPRFDHRFPRPLSPEQDRLIQEELMRRNDVASNALLLVRYTGLRIGECVDLPLDCLRSIAPGQWALHVPLGKLYTERLVPIDGSVQQIIHRLRFFRSLCPDPPDGLLLARRRGRNPLLRQLRPELLHVRTALGIERRITPHMFRHYAGFRTIPVQQGEKSERPVNVEAEPVRPRDNPA